MCTLHHLSLSPRKASEIERNKNKIATRAQKRTTARERNEEQQ
jgi:hypothetical protein